MGRPVQMSQRMKKFIVLPLLVFVVGMLYAQQRTSSQAELIAKVFIEKQSSGNHARPARVSSVYGQMETLNSGDIDEGNSPYYIFRDSATASFVIVSGDERMKTILGHSNQVGQNSHELPDGLSYLLDVYDQQYKFLQNGELEKEDQIQNINFVNVSPMMETQWNQGYPYNILCPSNCPSGCVAMAMSQVMKYHRYPQTGLSSFSYQSRSKRYLCSYDFKSAVFEWDLMSNEYPISSIGVSNSSINSVAQISYACGVSVGMDYTPNGSGAYMSDVPYALINFFGYNDNVSFCNRPCYKSEEWYDILCSELLNGRPVIYGGVDSREGGHAFVIDGCDALKEQFHINWGWGGDFDGYYSLDALNPNVYRFSTYQNMVIYVSPNVVGTHRDVFYADKFTASSNISIGKDVTFTLSDVICYSSQSSYVVPNAKFYGKIGVGVFDKNFAFVGSLGSSTVNGIQNFHGYPVLSYSTRIQASTFPHDGTYYIAPYVQASTSHEPTPIKTANGATDYIVIKIGEGGDGDTEDEDEHPIDGKVVWSESFENGIPENWTQEQEYGVGIWQTRSVLLPSASKPKACDGQVYAFLNFAADAKEIYNPRSVTRLITEPIQLDESKRYELSVQYRKYSSSPEPSDVFSIYYEKDDDWILLAESSLLNKEDWRKVSWQLPVTDRIRLSLEGSPSRGSSMFLDDLRICEMGNVSDVIRNEVAKDIDCLCKLYTLSGIFVTEISLRDIKNLNFPKGVYILRQNDKTSKISLE